MKEETIRTTGRLMVLAIIIKAIALIKTMLQASAFGANQLTDVYSIANEGLISIVNVFTVSISIAYIPDYISNKKDRANARKEASTILCGVTVCALIVATILFAFGPQIMKVLASVYDEEYVDQSGDFFRVLVFGFVFAVVASFLVGILNAEKKFLQSNLVSLTNSLSFIAMIVLFEAKIGIWSLVIAAIVAYVIEFIWLYIVGRKYVRFSLYYLKKGVFCKFLYIALPIIISQCSIAGYQIIEKVLLSRTDAGAVTAISYSKILYQFVTAIICTPILTVLFVDLAEMGKDQNAAGATKMLKDAERVVTCICIPIISVTLFSAKDITNIVYGRGEFSEEAITQTSIGLFFCILCLIPEVVKTLYVRAFYAFGNTKEPMFFIVLETVSCVCLAILLGTKLKMPGIMISMVITKWAFWLVMKKAFFSRYYRMQLSTKEEKANTIKIISALVVTMLCLLMCNKMHVESSFLSFVLNTFVAFSAYIMVLLVTREKTSYSCLNFLKRKINSR